MPRKANRIIVMRELELQRAKCEPREKTSCYQGGGEAGIKKV